MSQEYPPPYRAKKSLGQHFLVQKKIIQRICSDQSPTTKTILEVGPGPAVLTSTLAQLQKPFYVIEKDQRFLPELLKHLPEENITITDALEMDLLAFLEHRQLHNYVWLVSNLPYNVGVPLLVKFMQCLPIEKLTIMLQKEVGEKILGLKKSGSLFVLVNNYFSVEKLCLVPPSAFNPPPKVESIVLSLTRHPQPVIELSRFRELETFIRILFQFKRKQMKKVLQTRYKLAQIQEAFAQLNINQQERAENLSIQMVQKLFTIFTDLPAQE